MRATRKLAKDVGVWGAMGCDVEIPFDAGWVYCYPGSSIQKIKSAVWELGVSYVPRVFAWPPYGCLRPARHVTCIHCAAAALMSRYLM